MSKPAVDDQKRDTTWSEIGLWFRTANMEQIATHIPNDISWVPKNCRQNRRKANFRENTGSFYYTPWCSVILNFPRFLTQSCHLHVGYRVCIRRCTCPTYYPTVCPFICPFEVGLLVCRLIGLNASYNYAQWLRTLKNWTKIFLCPGAQERMSERSGAREQCGGSEQVSGASGWAKERANERVANLVITSQFRGAQNHCYAATIKWLFRSERTKQGKIQSQALFRVELDE